MNPLIISYDLGTGGNKASLFGAEGSRIASVFVHYDTIYPASGRHEQRPEDWWRAIVESTRLLLAEAAKKSVSIEEIVALAISGHSLGCVPLDAAGRVLRPATPIWSDSRAQKESEDFFRSFDPDEWYRRTGNGFPAPHYPLFKILWYKNNEPAIFEKTACFLGTKDYINFRLTGCTATDPSYASGCGAYRLDDRTYDDELMENAGLPKTFFPKIVASTEILGPLSSVAAGELGLSTKTLVAAGGVDNSCMALGAGCFRSGRLYASLGSSSWIAVSEARPLLDLRLKPYVFDHVVPGQYASALAIFSSGTSFRWIRDQLCRDLYEKADRDNRDVYELMIEEAEQSPLGANGLLFNPSLGGGSSLDESPAIRGAFLGLDLSHTRSDLIRSSMEGIALNLRLVLDAFRKLGDIRSQMNVVGGGARSEFWRQIYADALRIGIDKTNIGQDAAALGAAALAAVGAGLWSDFSPLDSVLHVEDSRTPDEDAAAVYDRTLERFTEDAVFLSGRACSKTTCR